MATQLGCYAQGNPKIDSLYAYLRARNLVYPYTLDNSLPVLGSYLLMKPIGTSKRTMGSEKC